MWFNKYTIEQINSACKNTLLEHLDIKFEKIGEDFLSASMPVDHRTCQPFRLLHGGASVALAESIGSMASWAVLDPNISYPVGLEINANHIRSATKGRVTGIAKAVHIGRSTHIWEIKIINEENKLVCISRLTMSIIKKT
tara:strand:- start:733 stop:1152 length:420 start_codon:yes stop_codon:yes gene_type:complete